MKWSVVRWFLFAFVAVTIVAVAATPGDPVAVDGGLIPGVDTASTGVRAYKGIPYAAPPVESLRWKPPQPVVTWQAQGPVRRPGPTSSAGSNHAYRRRFATAQTSPRSRVPK